LNILKAAALGNADAHHNLSVMYNKGQGVEKDMKKYLHHMEEAAIGGHHVARFNLGCYEQRQSNYDRAIKHFIIAAKLGDDGTLALAELKQGFQMGIVSKEDY
jgi:TPR repeat protein